MTLKPYDFSWILLQNLFKPMFVYCIEFDLDCFPFFWTFEDHVNIWHSRYKICSARKSMKRSDATMATLLSRWRSYLKPLASWNSIGLGCGASASCILFQLFEVWKPKVPKCSIRVGMMQRAPGIIIFLPIAHQTYDMTCFRSALLGDSVGCLVHPCFEPN